MDDQTKRVLRILEKENEVNEKFLAQALDTKINAVRKSLYKLMNSGFVSYTKKRDKKKQWWYLYYWTLNPQRIQDVWLKHKKKELHRRKKELESEKDVNFECERGCNKFTYDEALEKEFRCPHCDSGMVQVDNEEEIESIEKEITDLEKEIKNRRNVKSS